MPTFLLISNMSSLPERVPFHTISMDLQTKHRLHSRVGIHRYNERSCSDESSSLADFLEATKTRPSACASSQGSGDLIRCSKPVSIKVLSLWHNMEHTTWHLWKLLCPGSGRYAILDSPYNHVYAPILLLLFRLLLLSFFLHHEHGPDHRS